MSDNPVKKHRHSFLLMAVLLVACIGIEYYSHMVLGPDGVCVHLFYIPIFVTALRWSCKVVIPVSLFLGAVHAIPCLLSNDMPGLWSSLLLVLTGTVMGVISNRQKLPEKLSAETTKDDAWQQARFRHADRLAVVRRFTAGVAHEINNPLAVLHGTIQQMKEGSVLEGAVDKSKVDRMLRVSERIRDVVSGLLAFAGQDKPHKSEHDINKVLSEALTLTTVFLEKSGIEVSLRLSDYVPTVMVDQQQMKQVFLNLVDNAVDAMPKGGKLSISTEATANRAVIVFQDTGSGIAEEDPGDVFTPFFTTKEVGEGTGLGLSICYGIVKEHGGEILVDSEPGGGARFVILLPLR